MMRARNVVAACLVAVLVVGSAPAAEAADNPPRCEDLTPAQRLIVECIWGQDPPDENPSDDPDESPPDNGPIPDGVHCRWRAAYGSYVEEYLDDRFPEVPEGYVVAAHECAYFRDGAPMLRDDVVALMGYDWYAENLGTGAAVLPGATLDPAWNFTGEFALIPEGDIDGGLPSPEEVAGALMLRVETNLTVPEVATDPPCGPGDPLQCDQAIVNMPTFVEVTNWPDGGEITESGCDPTNTVCVEIVATPSLRFDPGESDSGDYIDCDGAGTRYDPTQGDPHDQAAVDGACAYAYTQRTGSSGQPDAWPARVEITWTATWSGGGQSGTFDDIAPTGTDLLRPVDEVQTIVTDVDLG